MTTRPLVSSMRSLLKTIILEAIKTTPGKQAPKQKTVGYFPGSFKPMHRGHYESILRMSGMVDELYVLMSIKDREDLSGEACKVYVETYILPTLPANVRFEFIDASPIRAVYDQIEKYEKSKSKAVSISLFAGPEDLGGRYNKLRLQAQFPKLFGEKRIRALPLPHVKAASASVRISGTAVREALANKNVAQLREMLPNTPLVQKNIQKIMQLLRS